MSTGEQADSGLGLEAQRQAIVRECEHKGWILVEVKADEGASGKTLDKRPALEQAMAGIEAGFAEALVVAKLDRLSRSVVDFGKILERARAGRWKVVVLDMDLDMTTATGEVVANVLMAFAQFERRLASDRTRAALAVRRSEGVRLGRQPVIPEKVVGRIRRDRDSGLSLRAIAARLNADAIPTAQGGEWRHSAVQAVLARS